MELESKALNGPAESREVKDAFDEFLRTFNAFKTENDEKLRQLERRSADAVSNEKVDRINAALDEHKRNLDELLLAISDRVRAMTEVTELLIPFDRGDVIASVHREGQVLVETPDADGLRIRARLEAGSVGRLREFVVE